MKASPKHDSPFIFVSYSSKDQIFVHKEVRRLKRQGCEIWYDSEGLEPALFWDDEISKAIKACACFVVFITRDALDSRHVRREIDLALAVGKPFISIYWEEVELPTKLQEPIRSRQALERYALHKSEYEEPLMRALAQYTEFKPSSAESRNTSKKTPEAAQPLPTADVLPKIVFFSLTLLAVLTLLLAASIFAAPYFYAATPNDPLSNRLVGLVISLVFAAVAFGLGGGAFAVHKVYLRRKHA
jgi:hypothetical protein